MVTAAALEVRVPKLGSTDIESKQRKDMHARTIRLLFENMLGAEVSEYKQAVGGILL